MIIAVYLPTKESHEFSSVDDAVRYTRIQKCRIQFCIDNGTRYKGWMFDEAIE